MAYQAVVTLEMPYEPRISVNSAYYPNHVKKRPEVVAWLEDMKAMLRRVIAEQGYGIPPIAQEGVRFDVGIRRTLERRGRPPDVQNFYKIPADAIAEVLGIDDWRFYGECTPLERVKGLPLEEQRILLHIRWAYSEGNAEYVKRNSLMAHGPVKDKDMRRKLGIPATACLGYASSYCIDTCPLPEYCPGEFTPAVFAKNPCSTCQVANCPCMNLDSVISQEKRVQAIHLWWATRVGQAS